MNLALTGSLSVPIESSNETVADSIRMRILDALRQEIKGIAIESQRPTIKYKRPLFQKAAGGIDSFNSGEIAIGLSATAVDVKYRLGVLPFIEQALGIAIVGFILGANELQPAVATGITVCVEVLLMIRIFFTWNSIQPWFREIISSPSVK